MMRSWLALVVSASLATAACGPGQVVITAEIEVPDPETEGAVKMAPIGDLEVQFLPFDRDAVFDSLANAFGTPEPPIPEEILQAQEQIASAQDAWRAAEASWGAGRDRLQAITQEMQGLARGEARYVALYREFQDVEGQVARAERAKEAAFQTFTDLQAGYLQRADSMRLIRLQWEDEAFANAGMAFQAKLDETGKEVLADTTDAQGVAGPIQVPVGQWWVHARYQLPFDELYWNILITVQRGDPLQVRLARETAQLRPKL
jgi:hypothetical protein